MYKTDMIKAVMQIAITDLDPEPVAEHLQHVSLAIRRFRAQLVSRYVAVKPFLLNDLIRCFGLSPEAAAKVTELGFRHLEDGRWRWETKRVDGSAIAEGKETRRRIVESMEIDVWYTAPALCERVRSVDSFNMPKHQGRYRRHFGNLLLEYPDQIEIRKIGGGRGKNEILEIRRKL